MRIEKSKQSIHQFITILMVLAVTATPAVAREDAPSTDTLSINELSLAANLIRKFKPKDEFDEPTGTSSLTGRHFSVVVKPRKRGPTNAICQGYPSWGYYPSKGKYEVEFGGANILVERFMNVPFASAFPDDGALTSSFLPFVAFTCQQSRGRSYQASNAFGATTTVEKRKDLVIAFSDQEKPDVGPNTAEKSYWSQVIAGDAARSLSETVSIRIRGVIGRWPNGQNILCGVRHNEPTFDYPYDESLDACIYKVESLSFEVMNTRTNEVLYETNPSAKK